jgi:hypothetical protein
MELGIEPLADLVEGQSPALMLGYERATLSATREEARGLLQG